MWNDDDQQLGPEDEATPTFELRTAFQKSRKRSNATEGIQFDRLLKLEDKTCIKGHCLGIWLCLLEHLLG